MLYFKALDGDSFLGIATELDLCKVKERSGLPPLHLCCKIEGAQYIVINDTYYHANSLRPESIKGLHPTVTLKEITKEEYESIQNIIETGNLDKIPDETDNNENVDETPIDQETEVTIEFVRKNKLKALSTTCEDIIMSGIDVVLSDGQAHHFSLNTNDQLNLITLSTMVASGETSIPYHADGEACKFYSVADINEILNRATAHKTFHISYYNSLKTYVSSLTSIEEISKVNYGDNIPVKYQSDVLQTLFAQS